MRIATNTTIYDGQTYREGDEIPDLGSWGKQKQRTVSGINWT